MLAYPVETVPSNARALDRLTALVAEYEPAVVFVGLPVSLRGRNELAATKVLGHASRFAAAVDCEVRLVDERMTTVTASRQLREAGRKARQQRSVIDQAAAVAILQHAIDTAKTRGSLPGEVVLPGSNPGPTAPKEDPA